MSAQNSLLAGGYGKVSRKQLPGVVAVIRAAGSGCQVLLIPLDADREADVHMLGTFTGKTCLYMT